MQKFEAVVTQEVHVEIEMADDFDILDDSEENEEQIEEFRDKIYAAIPDGVVHHSSISAWDATQKQVL